MGFCSYCFQPAGSSYGQSDECFSWSEATGCSGISGPDDPVRVARQKKYYTDKAKRLRKDATEVVDNAARKSLALFKEADGLEAEWK